MDAGYRVELQPAWLLHQRDFRETSRICEFFSLEFGRISLLAKGVRGKRAKNTGILQPFRPLLVSWQGRSELKTLTNLELAGEPVQLVDDALLCGFYLNELLMRLCGRLDPQPELQAAYGIALATLGSQNQSLSVTLRQFEKRLLDSLGYGLVLDVDNDGEPIRATARYRYDPELGLTATVATGQGCYSGRVLQAIALEEFSDSDVAAIARQLFRQAIDTLLDSDQPLRSRQLLMQTRTRQA